ncbi:MAG: SMC-Scp complex subunit ScpB [Planctomycetota bacterium]|nr:SMC-Scp complex subunit ScpB [Planctomycetota bacterium]
MSETPLKTIVEAILFASDQPVSADRLADAAGEDVAVGMVKRCVEELLADYDAQGRAFTIEEVAGGYQLFTRPEYNKYLKPLVRARQQARLTQAALETLAIIAYKQPVARAEVEDIRGVACGDMIRALMEKGLVRIAGRSEQLGRALLYGTTKKFLQAFGLSSVKDLPDSKQLVQP